MKHPIQAFAYKIVNQSEDTVDVYIDGSIVDAETQDMIRAWLGEDSSVSYRSFRDQIEQINPRNINVYINSPGGLVTDAMAIHDYLQAYKAKGGTVNTIGRGIVASAATYILMAGGENSALSENSWFMIHNVSGGVWGDVNTVESYANKMRQFNNSIVSFYAKATGMSEEEITKLMDKETWMSAKEAREKGFVKKVTDKADYTNTISPDHWPYANRAVLNAYNAGVKKPEATGQPEHNNFFTSLQNGFMKLINELTNAIKNGKGNNEFEKIENRDAILDMVEQVLTPFVNKVDEALEAVKQPKNVHKVPVKGEGEAESTETAETTTETSATETEEEKQKREEEEARKQEEENEIANLKKKLENQEAELAKLRNDLAAKVTQPNNSNGAKRGAARAKIEYAE